MIGKMTRYDFILLKGETEAFLNALQDLGVVDLTRSDKPVDEASVAMLSSIDRLSRKISWMKAGDYSKDEEYESILKKLEEAYAERELRAPWGCFDKSKLDEFESIGRKIRFYEVSKKKFDESWAELQPLEIIGENGSKVWFVTIGPAEGYDFPIPETKAPEGDVSASDELIASLKTELDKRAGELEKEKELIPGLEEEKHQMLSELDKYLAKEGKADYSGESLTVFTGFAPVESDSMVQEALDKMDCYWIAEAATAEDKPPITFRNNRFVRMFEPLVDMYGRPSYDGFDPTPFLSIFFLLFFAMCMGDMGYGLVLLIVGLLLGKVDSFKSFAPLVTTLGIGTAIVGFFFHTFFSIDFSGAAWLPEGLRSIMLPAQIAGYDGTMVAAIAIGVIHLLLAMIVKTVYATKNQGFLNSLSAWGWTVFWTGLVIIALTALAGVIDKSVTKWAIIILGIICAIGIFPLNNMHRNPLVNVGSGLWDTYNMATGILGDVLSYLRLYALGLAGAMLGFAFNDLAKMALGDGGFGWVPFILIVVVGHTLNLAMAALGAFVHPLRLNFLEFFKNSGYEGSGQKYKPLKK